MQDDPTKTAENEETTSPSQEALDQQTGQQAAYAEAERRGRINFASGEILAKQQQGGNAEAARTLLGRLDSLAANPQYEDDASVRSIYNDYRAYVHGGNAPASQPSGPTPAPPKRTIDKSKARQDYAEGRMTTAEAEKLGIL